MPHDGCTQRVSDLDRPCRARDDRRPSHLNPPVGAGMTVSARPSGKRRGRRIQYALESASATGAPFESQQQFHNSLSRFKGYSGPIGAGKSQALCYEALKLAYLNRGCPGLIGAPTYPMLRDSTRLAFLEMLEQNQVPHRFAKSSNTVYLPEPRSLILFRSLDSFERLRGTNLA